jgi:glycosyltransferase involved in cell wall biosynthesis
MLNGRRKPFISIITSALPERAHLLEELQETVRAQTYPRWEHLIFTDDDRVGAAKGTNAAAAQARGTWLFPIADDDLLKPDCLEVHLAHSDSFQFVYSPPEVIGEPSGQFHGSPPNIPSSCLILREAWERLGGYDESLGCREDNDLYVRALQAQMRFWRVEQTLWTYRFWTGPDGRPGNKSRQ